MLRVAYLVVFGISLSFQAYSLPNLSVSNVAQTIRHNLAVCVLDPKVENNISYFHLPRGMSDLECEIGNQVIQGKLNAFYNDGWKITQIVNIDSRLQTAKGTVPYSLIYLEKTTIHSNNSK